MAQPKIKSPQENVKVTMANGILRIDIDMSQDFGPSKSGKSNMIASTAGFIPVAEGCSLNLNVVRKR